MAGSTSNYSFPYPENSDPVDVAGDVQALADSVDSTLFTQLATKAPTASPTFTGNVALPSTTTLNGVTLAIPSLRLITTANLSGSATSVNNCFTSTYANYLLVVSGLYFSGAGYARMRLRASGTDATASSYKWAGQNIVYAGTVFGNSSTGADAFDLSGDPGSNANNPTGIVITVTSPQLATATGVVIDSTPDGTASWRRGQLQTTTQYDGFTIFPSAGTMSGGIVRVYGLLNS